MTLARRTSKPSKPSKPSAINRIAEGFAAAASSPSTRKAYLAQWNAFKQWWFEQCFEQSPVSLPAPPEVVAQYVAYLGTTSSPSTIDQALAAIRKAHLMAEVSSPTAAPQVRAVRAGVRRTLGVAPQQARPLTVDGLRLMLQRIDAQRWVQVGAVIRMPKEQAKALLLVGWAGALRSSELVGLKIGDVEIVRRQGMRLRVGALGVARTIGIPYAAKRDVCPVRAVEAWLVLRRQRSYTGSLFIAPDEHERLRELAPRAISRLVARLARRVGLGDEGWSSHSLRAGFIAAAAAAGTPPEVIARQTGHRSLRHLVASIQDAKALDKDNPVRGLL